MIIQVSTNSDIEGNSEVAQQIKIVVRNSLDHFSGLITRVEVHLSDVSSDKKFGIEDNRCLLEARLAGIRPVTVSHRGVTLDQAVEGAVDKLRRSLTSTIGRLGERKTHDTSGHNNRADKVSV